MIRHTVTRKLSVSLCVFFVRRFNTDITGKLAHHHELYANSATPIIEGRTQQNCTEDRAGRLLRAAYVTYAVQRVHC
jgi:hypothetical protein